MIEGMHWLFFTVLGGPLSAMAGIAYTVPLLALGGIVVGLLTCYFAPEAKGHGVPEVMVAVAYRGGRIRPRITLFKALTAAITIGSGGSAGREGPIVQVGAAFGSALAQFFGLSDRRMTLAVACGAAGGIAATFNAPIGGVMFALEVILARFTSLTFGLVVISATTATVVSRALLGDNPAFAIPVQYNGTNFTEIMLFGVLGVLCAIVAQVYFRAVFAVETVSDRLRMPEYLKPALGAAMVGVIGIWLPQVFGNGYEIIENALRGNYLLLTLALLCAGKIVATALTVGSGGSGGVFAPSLYVGAMFGGAFGSVCNILMPGHVSSVGAFALVGMAAVFGGAAHAPITAVFILFEMTDNYTIILPLMAATVLSTFVCQRISTDSMYTIRLRRRGIHIGGVQDINLMDALTVNDAMSREFESVRPDYPLTALIMKFATGRGTGFPVVGKDGKLEGIVTEHDVENGLIDRNPDRLKVRDISTKNVVVVRPDQSLNHALGLLASHNVNRLPVIDPNDPARIIGMLTRSDVVSAYATAYRQGGRRMLRRLDEMNVLGRAGESILEEEVVTYGGALAGKLVKEVGFPQGMVLVKVKRGGEQIVPNGSTKLLPGDELVALCARRKARQIREWLKQHR
jgi:CIC family chloride channel protein